MEIPSKRTVTVSQSRVAKNCMYLEFHDEDGHVMYTSTMSHCCPEHMQEIVIAQGKWIHRGEIEFTLL